MEDMMKYEESVNNRFAALSAQVQEAPSQALGKIDETRNAKFDEANDALRTERARVEDTTRNTNEAVSKLGSEGMSGLLDQIRGINERERQAFKKP